jgi:hypothetical protein
MFPAKHYIKTSFLLIAFAFPFFAFSQPLVFTNVNPFIGDIPLIYENNFGSGVSFFDVDEDGWDDLTLCTDTGDTRYYRNIQGQFVFTYNFKNTKNAKACVWGDVNEDGYNDLIVTRAIHLFKYLSDWKIRLCQPTKALVLRWAI